MQEKGMTYNKIKKDCFAYHAESCECMALDELMCCYGKCSFYKQRDKVEKQAKTQKEKQKERKKRYTISHY